MYDNQYDIYHPNFGADPALRPTVKVDLDYKEGLQEQIDERRNRTKSYVATKPPLSDMTRAQSCDNISAVIKKNKEFQ